MNQLFQTYNQKYDHLKDLLQDDVPRSLRLFNIRFRLALDIQIDFKRRNYINKVKTGKRHIRSNNQTNGNMECLARLFLIMPEI